MELPSFVKKLLVFNQIEWAEGDLVVHGVKTIILPAEILVLLQEALEKELGEEKAHRIVHDLGKEQGKRGFERYKQMKKIEQTFEDMELENLKGDPVVKMGQIFFEIAGFGKCNYDWLKAENCVLSEIKNSPFAKAHLKFHKASNKPVCHFIAGMFEGAEEVVTGKKVDCKEINCAAQGISPICIFKGKIKD